MENCLPFTDDVMVVLVHKCVQQTHLLALHLETLGYIPRLLNALNGLVYFLIIGDPRGDNLMVGSISRKLLTELGIRTEDAECKLMGDKPQNNDGRTSRIYFDNVMLTSRKPCQHNNNNN